MLKRRERKKKQRKWKKILFVVLTLTILFLLGLFLFFMTSSLKNASTHTPKNIVNILFLGIDKRETSLAKTDTLILLTADLDKQSLSFLFIPRDTRVAIKENGYDKINHAFAFGKDSLTVETVENLLATDIDHYVRLDVEGTQKIIDALGGVDIDVEEDMHYTDPFAQEGLTIELEQGTQKLLGKNSTDYLRYQGVAGEVGRMSHAEEFIKSFLTTFHTADTFTLAKTLFLAKDEVKTDMSAREIISLFRFLLELSPGDVTFDTLRGKSAIFEKVKYFLPSIVENRLNLREKMSLPLDEEEKASFEEDQKRYLLDLPETVYEDKKGTEQKVKIAEKTAQKIMHQEAKNSVEEPLLREPSEEETKTTKSPDEQLTDDKLKIARSKISVKVINSSGINGAGKEVGAILKELGYQVTEVRTGEYSDRLKTTITTPTEQLEGFFGMPFPCILMDGGTTGHAVVNIGKDYRP